MAYLLFRILLTVSFSHLVRFLQVRTERTLPAALVNYMVATVVSAALALAWGARGLSWTAAWLGAVGGVTYVTSLVLMLPAMRQAGVAVSGAILQLALMVPVSLAVWRYGERLTVYHLVGILLTCISLPILSASTVTGEEQPRPARRWSPLLALLFLSSGVSQTVMKELVFQTPAPADRMAFMAVLFAVATLGTWLWMVWRRSVPETDHPSGVPRMASPAIDWAVGVPLGLVNAGQLVCLLLALRDLPAIVVFPVSSALGLVANVAVSLWLWRERPARSAWLGIALATVAVLLLSL